jgi:hypothetical protein
MHKQIHHETLALGEDITKTLSKVLIKVWIPKACAVNSKFTKVDDQFRIFCVCSLEKVLTQLMDDRSKNRITFLFQNITILPEREFQMKNLNLEA